MMTKEELVKRYTELYNKMKESRNVKYMRIFGESEKYMFGELAGRHPDIAERWLSHLEPVCWHNYLSEHEAMNIGKEIENQDGTLGYHWDYHVFVSAVKQLGGKVEDKPYYNSYALWATANMIYSDHAESIAEDMGYDKVMNVPNERMALSCYKKAVEKLKDVDNDDFVRDYFRGKMYDKG